nr:unnamed protein product [Callosobruchus chinensis]
MATVAGKKLGYLFRARKYFSPSNLLTLYKAQIIPSLSLAHISWKLLPLLPCLYLIQSREGQSESSTLGIDVENPLCRKCGEAVETAKHVIFDCPALCRRRSSYLEVVQEEGRQVVLATACYVTRSTDPLICFVGEHEKAGKGAFLFKAAIRAAEELSLAIDFTRRCQQSITELAPAQLKTHIKAAQVEFLLKLHKDKPMHGIFYKHLEEHGLSQQLTFSFLRSIGLKSETKGFIMACQDGVFNTLVYRSRVMGVNVPDARCRACRQARDSYASLVSLYAGTAYVHRHNAALRVLYYHLRHSYGIDETPVLPYAPGDIESVVENERCRIYWNYSFHTLELVQANKPDKTMFIIEFSAPAEVNIVSKEEEKRTKYQELLGQLRRL